MDQPLEGEKLQRAAGREMLTPSRAGNDSSSDDQRGTHYPQHYLARTPSASLIKSAVRSVLDDATPSSIMSDDRSDDGSCVDGETALPKFSSSPGLTSLRMETLAPIPTEQDRRRFIGCLAAILASAYAYDEVEEETLILDINAGGSFAYFDDTDDDSSDQEGEETDEIYSAKNVSRNRISTDETSRISYDKEFPSEKQNDYMSSKKVPSGGLSNPQSQPPGVSARYTSRPSLPSATNNAWGKSSKERIRISRQRIRRRRYDVFCQFLISSNELLMLDKSVARAFIPMLTRVLKPPARAVANEQIKIAAQGPPLSTPNQKRRVHVQSAPSSPAERVQPMNTDFLPNDDWKVDFSRPSVSKSNLSSSDVEHDRVSALEVGNSGDDDILRPFLESMTPGSGFRCLALLLLQHLLTSEVGYDARIRFVLKKLGVLVLMHDISNDPVEFELLPGNFDGGEGERPRSNSPTFYKELVTHATRKFESLEQSIAHRLIRLSETKPDMRGKANMVDANRSKPSGLTKDKVLRGVKIGSAGLVAGTLFAFTGGLAAPGIAAGVAALAGSTAAATAAVVTLTSTVVVTTIFGVGGGSLAAYKMQRRTQGLTEFEFNKESMDYKFRRERNHRPVDKHSLEAELFTTVCISGWLRDKFDYQRPWGLHPTNPRLASPLELLERFYSIFRPDHLPNCTRILNSWRGEKAQLWSVLREKYGRDPDHLFPLASGPRVNGSLTLDQEEALDQIFVELGYNSVAPSTQLPKRQQPTPFERMREGWRDIDRPQPETSQDVPGVDGKMNGQLAWPLQKSHATANFETVPIVKNDPGNETEGEYEPPKHLATVWDFKTTYGGELYTVRWESELLTTICDCVMDLAMDVVSGATRQFLKQTILSTLLAAVVWPTYLLNVANMIDGDWTLAVERADEAGKELAKTLLRSRAGQRPVTLVGFSFGARIIYSCLKELSRLQEEWEEYEEFKTKEEKRSAVDQHRFAKLEQKFNGMREPSSVVEEVVMMGLPNHLSLPSWRACRQIVAGRLVNCYSTKDLILSLMFQAKRFSPGVQTILKPVCGTCQVNLPGVENIDVSDLVQGHQDYCLITGEILKRVNFGEPLRNDVMKHDSGLGSAGLTAKFQI